MRVLSLLPLSQENKKEEEEKEEGGKENEGKKPRLPTESM